jgi:hypothetical protein
MREYYRLNAQRVRETALASRKRRLDAVREYDRSRARVRNPEKQRVQRAAYGAIKRGRLVRLPCEVCGSEMVDAHHDDYSKPFDVRWLCRTHHMELHRTVAA